MARSQYEWDNALDLPDDDPYDDEEDDDGEEE